MGYGWNTRSPEDVQRYNGRAYDFNKIAQRYDEVKPLGGKRKNENIRPHSERSRCHERIVKVSDNEYFLTNNAYRWHNKHNYTVHRAITFKRNDDGTEVVIVHTPRQYWGDESLRANLIPKQLGVPSTYFFYTYNLPEGLNMYKFHSKNYLQVQEDAVTTKYYTLDKGDVHLTRQVGDKYFKPLIVHRESKRSLDRAKTKVLRQELAPFLEYMRVMLPLAEADRQRCWQDPIYYADYKDDDHIYSLDGLAQHCVKKGWRGLFTGEENELWFNLVQYYKHKCMKRQWSSQVREYVDTGCDPKSVARLITNTVYYKEKPIKEEPVELGMRTFDKYRTW